MKIKNCLLLAMALISSVACSSATKITAENVNANLSGNSNLTATTAATAATTPAADNRAAQIAPDALIKDLYKQHDADKSPFFQKKSRALVDKYFDKTLADTIWKEANETRDGIGALDADPLYSAQDTDIKNFVVGQPKITGDKAEVIVAFDNFKVKEKFTYLLVKENGEWKISDINYGDFTLSGIYREYNKSAANDKTGAGEFAGRYQIGDTTCTVEPVKMAFEVRWEKGSGVEIFFYEGRDGKRIFASEQKSGKANTFAFDDENYNTGTFHRADGKEFPISRVK